MRLEMRFTAEGLLKKTCDAHVEWTLRPRGAPLRRIEMNAADMEVLAVELPSEAKAPEYAYDDRRLSIELPRAVGPDETLKVRISYRLSEPSQGLHFVLPNASAPDKPVMVYTFSEPVAARYWLPSHDWPNELWTADLLITAPAKYTVVANGVLVGKPASGEYVTHHWRQAAPTDGHMLGFVLGELVELRDTWRGKPVMIYTQRGLEEAARYTFARVPEMLEQFTKLTGVDYPYPGYTHVTVADHLHGAMEQSGYSIVAPVNLSDAADGRMPREVLEGMFTAHMLAHQWFGGLVNYRSLSQLWLNEGLATYLQWQWVAHDDPTGGLECEMWRWAQFIARNDSSETGKPMVNRDLGDLSDPESMFYYDGAKIYYKGAWVLHMLSHRLSPEIFWKGVARYLEQNRGRGVETSDLQRALEEVSGLDLEQFFRQWVYGHGVPRLKVSYAWDGVAKKTSIKVEQTQKTDAETPAFVFPLALWFRTADGERRETLNVSEAKHEQTYEFEAEPTAFFPDPDGAILKSFELDVPLVMLTELTRSGPTALSRMIAVQSLAGRDRPEAVDALAAVLRNDREQRLVRRAAAETLGKMQTDGALEALLDAEQAGVGPPRVLSYILDALGQYVASTEAHARVLRHASAQSPMWVQSAAIDALGTLRVAPDAMSQSLAALIDVARSRTRRWVRLGALYSLRALEAREAYDAVLELAQPGRGDDLRSEAIDALGVLGRHDELRDRTREQLTAWLYDPDPPAQAAAVRALGSLGDPRAIPDLTRLSASARAQSLRLLADKAIKAIQTPQDPKAATTALLERLAALEKSNEAMERKVKELVETIEALKVERESKGSGKSKKSGKKP